MSPRTFLRRRTDAACPRAVVAALTLLAVPPLGHVAAETDPAPADSTYQFVHPDSLALYRTYDRRYIREDTLDVPFTYIYRDDIEVTAKRLSLEEILERCIESEKHQYDAVDDISFRITERAVMFYGKPEDPLAKRTIHESISRVYRKQPDHMRVAELSEREYTLEEKGGVLVRTDEKNEVELDVHSTSMELSDIPFFFEELSDYEFGIEERVDLEDRVLYRISFVPRSDFDPLPKGEFWIDTADFRIFHTDLTFMDNVPVPLILKGVDHASIEMKRVDDIWVYDRITARVQLRKLPFVPIPRQVEIVVAFDEYEINRGLALDVFGERK